MNSKVNLKFAHLLTCVFVAPFLLALTLPEHAPITCKQGEVLNKATRACVRFGGEIPIPFSLPNTKVELADSEFYELVGIVEFINEQPFLKVDLDQHPWLASVRRIASPYYPLEQKNVARRIGRGGWKPFENERVVVAVQAKSLIAIRKSTNESKCADHSYLLSDDEYYHLIVLKPVLPPARF